MSRNVRQKKKTAAPVKKVQRRRRFSTSSSSLDLSGEGGYSGVDDISDSSDDDEEDVDAAEEEHMIAGELVPTSSTARSPRPLPNDDADDADEEDQDEDDNDVDEEDEDEEDEVDGDDTSESSSSVQLRSSPVPPEPVVAERHVRFAGVPDSDSDSTTSDVTDHNGDFFFPDIFVDQASLDPAFRREIEQDDDDDSSTGSGSFWHFQSAYETMYNSNPVSCTVSDEDTPIATPSGVSALSSPAVEVEEDDDDSDLDGYETDGETTEEEIPDPPVRRKLPRRVWSVESSESDTDMPIKRTSRGQPRVGTFKLKSTHTKPIAVLNPRTGKMMIFHPQRLRELDFSLSPESYNLDNVDPFGTPGMAESSPILSNSGTLMLGAMVSSNTFGDFMNTQTVGSPSAFFAATDGLFPEGTFLRDDDVDSSEVDAEEDEAHDAAEDNLKLDDLVIFGGGFTSSESEAEDDGGHGCNNYDVNDEDMFSSPSRHPSTAPDADDNGNALHPLLNHFQNNSEAVGAFRRNQVNQQLILSDKATKESLLFSNAYSLGTLRGVRSDSLGNVATPLTPARRRKHASSLTAIPDSSPLQSVAQKRKASATISEGSSSQHKRQRSISDVQLLGI